MINYSKHGPIICIASLLLAFFLLWFFFHGFQSDYYYPSASTKFITPDQSSVTSDIINVTDTDITNVINEGSDTNDLPERFNSHNEICERTNSQVPSLFGLKDVPEPSIVIDQTPSLPSFYANSELDVCVGTVDTQINSDPKLKPEIKKKPRVPQVSKGERICNQTLEKIYRVPFVKVRPAWLTNPETGKTLELDCYNDELKLAVEYNGEQHYKWPNWFHKSYDEFIRQVRRDRLKSELCELHGIYLIIVPYNVPLMKIQDFIISHLPETIQKRIQNDKNII